MAFLKIFASMAVMLVLTKACSIQESGIEKMAEVCMGKVALHHPSIIGKMGKLMGGQVTSQKEKVDIVCDSKIELVEWVQCMLEEVKPCLPAGTEVILSMLPTKERLMQGFEYMCKHKNVLSSNCMENQLQSFMGCYMGRVQALRSDGAAMLSLLSNPKALMCKVVRAEEQCVEENHGSCTKDFVDKVTGTLDTFFGTSDCPASQPQREPESKKYSVESSLLGHLLVHGRPVGSLKFQPKYSGYNYNPISIKH